MSAMSKRFENIKQGKVPADNIKESAACADKAADDDKSLPVQVQGAVPESNGAGGLPATAVKDVGAVVGSTPDKDNLTKVVPAVEQESGLPATAVKDVAAVVGSGDEDKPLEEGVPAVRSPKFTDGQLAGIGNEGIFSGALVGFLTGAFGTTWLGHRHGSNVKEIAELEKKLEERQAHLKQLESRLESQLREAASKSKSPSNEGLVGAAGGAAGGVALAAVGLGPIGTAILGGVLGKKIGDTVKEAKATSDEIHELREKLNRLSDASVKKAAVEVEKIEKKEVSTESLPSKFSMDVSSLEALSGLSGSFLGFFTGFIGTGYAGHRYEAEVKRLKELTKEREELKRKVDAAEAGVVSSIRRGVQEGTRAGVEDLKGAAIGAAAGLGATVGGMAAAGPVGAWVSNSAVGAAYGSKIASQNEELEKLRARLAAVDKEIDHITFKTLSAGTEDLDPGAMKLHPATVFAPKAEHCDEAADAYRQLEADATLESLESLESICHQLDSVKASVESMNANGGVSAASAYFASAAVRTMHRRLNLPASAVVKGLESAVEAAEHQVVSTEALEASLGTVTNGTQSMWKRFVSTLVRGNNPIWTRARIASMALKGIKSRAQKAKFEASQISVPRRVVALGESTAPDLNKAFTEAAVKLNYMVTDFTRQADADYLFNEKMILKLAKEKSGIVSRSFATAGHQRRVAEGIPSIVSQWRDPRTKLGADPSAPLIGNIVLFESKEAPSKDEDKNVRFLADKARQNIPVLAGYHARSTERGSVDVKGLSSQEIVAISDALAKALEGVSLWKRIVSNLSVPVMNVHFHMRARHNIATDAGGLTTTLWSSRSAGPVIGELVAALRISNRMRFHAGFDAALALLKVIKNFNVVAKRSTSASLKASSEAFDDNTEVNGMSTNDMSKNEPNQVPVKGGTAIAGEIQPKKPSINDEPATFQTIENQPGAQHGMESFHEALPYWA